MLIGTKLKYFVCTSILLSFFIVDTSYSCLSSTTASIFPANGSTNQSITITQMNQFRGALPYITQKNGDTKFNDLIDDQSGITNTSYQVSELNSMPVGYRRVSATPFPIISSDWSSVWLLSKVHNRNFSSLLKESQPLFCASGSLSKLWKESALLTNTSVQNELSIDNVGFEKNEKSSWNENLNNTSSYQEYNSQADSISVVPEIPVQKSPANDSANIPLYPILCWNYSKNASSYRVQVSTDQDFKNVVMDVDSIPANYSQAGRLLLKTKYFWHVSAQGDSGLSSSWSPTWYFTTLEDDSITPILVTPDDGIKNQPLNVITFWTEVSGAELYKIYVSTTPDFEEIFDLDSTKNSSYTIKNLFNSTTYFWHVQAKIKGTWKIFSSTSSFSTRILPPEYMDISAEVSFPTHTDFALFHTSDYRLVGLPGAPNITMDSLLTGDPEKSWRAYWDNGQSENYMIKYDASEKFIFTMGKAFWIIKNGPVEINFHVENAPTNDKGNVEIPLHSGWNLITNPTTASISWSDVKTLNHTLDALYSYNGTYQVSQKLLPYNGYYYFNSIEATYLEIPLVGAATSVKKNSDDENSNVIQQLDDSPDWTINISLSSGEYSDSSAWIGVSSKVTDIPNSYDLHKPSGFEGVPAIYFIRPEWDKNYSTFATDIKPVFNTSNEWTFQVQSPAWQKATLKFDNINKVPREYDVYLLNTSNHEWTNLRSRDKYEFTPVASKTDFQIVIGSSDAVNQKRNSDADKTSAYILGNNYPDPFNNSTTFSVSLPEDSNVEISIYNVIGQHIKTIYKGQLQSGIHWFNWAGKDEGNNNVSSGIYFYRFSASSGVTFIKKMMLLK